MIKPIEKLFNALALFSIASLILFGKLIVFIYGGPEDEKTEE